MQLEVKINLILHATENESKVLEKLESTFHIEQKNFQIEEIPGHFNNPILLIEKKICRKFYKSIFFKYEKN
jgi:hypothetical protein